MNRPHLIAWALLAAGLFAGVCHSLGSQPDAGLTPPAAITGRDKTIIIVRHGEKQDASNDAELSAAGRQRALRLVPMLRDAGVDTVYFSDRKRTQQTANELIRVLNIPSERQRKYTATDDPSKLTQSVLADKEGQVLLIVGHSNTIPGLLKEFGSWNEPPLSEQDFENVYIVTVRESATPRLLRLGYPPASTMPK
jgi:2,3-bisphosphoglycerate-dependent phosphoglycerate mutase